MVTRTHRFNFFKNTLNSCKQIKPTRMDDALQETEEDYEQYFLPEILCKILQNLNIKDLSLAASVSKLWNEEAKKEQMKRKLEKVIISVTNNQVYDSVRVKPYVTLMFIAPKNGECRHLQIDAIKKYKDYFPNNLVTVGLPSVIVDQELISCNREMSEGGLLSVLIPEYGDLKIRTAYNKDLNDMWDASEFVNEFLPQDSHSKVTFIIFGQIVMGPRYENKRFFNSLKESMHERQQEFSLWGGYFDNGPLVAMNGQINENYMEECRIANEMEYNSTFAMSITGSRLNSSSIVINCSIRKLEFDRKLSEFRKQVIFKRHRIGLVCGPEIVEETIGTDSPHQYSTFSEMMHAVKMVFPEIPCIGICDSDCCGRYYGLKSKKDDPDQQLQHQDSVSLMILTYD